MTKLVDSVNQNEPSPDDLLEAIHALRHLFVGKQYKASSGDLDLSHAAGKALSFLSRNPGATQKDLSAYFSRDKGQIARLTAGLKERLFIESGEDTADRRIQRLYLTERGREARAENDRKRARLAKIAVAGLRAEDRKRLMALLSRIRENLEQA